jgi:type I restriction enzyme S subunit
VSNVRGGWSQTTSGELCEYITSGSRDWKKYYSDEGALFIRTQDINTDKLDLSDVARVKLPPQVEGKRSRLQAGDLLVTITGANVGKVALVPDDIPEAYVSQSVGLMRLKDRRFGKYIHYYLQGERSGRHHVMNMVYGMGRPVLSLQNLRDIPIPLAPLDEQKEIVAEIEKQFTRLDAGVAGLRRVQANLERYRAAVLKAACEGKLVPTEAELARQEGRGYETGAQLLERILAERCQKWNGKGKYKEPAKPDTANLPALSDGWAWATVEQISSWLPGSIQSGPFGSQLLHSEFVSDGILAIGIDNIRDGSFSLGSNHRIKREKYSLLSKFTARSGDVVVTVMATVGRVCVLPENLEPAIITKHCYRITPATEGITSRFLALTFRADAPTRWHIFGNVRGQTRPGINGPILKAAPVPVPPIAEQQRIVAEVERRLSVVEELESAVNANLHRATRLRQSILQRAFNG